MNPPGTRCYQLGDFRLDLSRRSLSRAGEDSVPLTGRAFDVLAYLVENRHRVVGKDEVIAAVWPRVVVEENNLTQAISAARRALGDSSASPRYIATIAGRGYQYVGDVRAVMAPELDSQPAAPLVDVPDRAAPSQAAEPAAAPPFYSRRALMLSVAIVGGATLAGLAWRRSRSVDRLPDSIAVLPFKPLGGGPRDAAVEIGTAELLINRLSSTRVIVSPLSSVLKYAAPDVDPRLAGRALGVDAVVEGYVQIRDGRVRLTARLIDVADGRALWSGDFIERMDDFFAMQDSLASQVAFALAAPGPGAAQNRLPGYGTRNADAWQLYANGRYQLQKRDEAGLREARARFEAAERLDPKFALASAGLSEAWAVAAVWGIEPPGPAMSEAKRAAQRAISSDENLPDGHLALGHVLTQYELSFVAARALYQRALALNPKSAYAHALMALNLTQNGRFAAALEHIGHAQALEPAALPFQAMAGFVLYFAGRTEESARKLGQLVQSAPAAVMPRQFLARTLLQRNDARGVITLLQGQNDSAPGAFSNLARAYAMTGRGDEARAEVARVEALGERGFGVSFDLALVHLALGERERALAAIERAVDDHSQMVGYMRVEPALISVRGDPRFEAVARRIRFG